MAGKAAKNIEFHLNKVYLKNPIHQGLNIAGSLLGVITGRYSIEDTELLVSIQLQVKNKNDFTLDISRLTYTLFLNKEDIGSGEKNEKIKIEAGREKTIELPLKVYPGKALSQTLEGILNIELNDSVKGEVTVNAPFGESTFPFIAEKGKIEIGK